MQSVILHESPTFMIRIPFFLMPFKKISFFSSMEIQIIITLTQLTPFLICVIFPNLPTRETQLPYLLLVFVMYIAPNVWRIGLAIPWNINMDCFSKRQLEISQIANSEPTVKIHLFCRKISPSYQKPIV